MRVTFHSWNLSCLLRLWSHVLSLALENPVLCPAPTLPTLLPPLTAEWQPIMSGSLRFPLCPQTSKSVLFYDSCLTPHYAKLQKRLPCWCHKSLSQVLLLCVTFGNYLHNSLNTHSYESQESIFTLGVNSIINPHQEHTTEARGSGTSLKSQHSGG